MDLHKQLIAENAKQEIHAIRDKQAVLDKQLGYQYELLNKHCQHPRETINRKYDAVIHTCELCSKILKYYNETNTESTPDAKNSYY